MHNHNFDFFKKDVFIQKRKCIPIKILKCKCGVVQIIDIEKCRIISCNGKYGEEIKI
jgi:hypothetical protein